MDHETAIARLFETCLDEQGHIDKRMLHARGVLSDVNLFGPEDAVDPLYLHRPLVQAKGFCASGWIDEMAFWVAVFWGGEIAHGTQLRGDARIESWLRQRAGEVVEHPRTEIGIVTLDVNDPSTILAALWTHARSFRWHGDAPYERRRSSYEQEDLFPDLPLL